MRLGYSIAILLALGSASPALADTPAGQETSLTAAELFIAADAARDAGNFAGAELAYRALTHDAEPELRIEAHYRLGMMMADRLSRHRDAAIEFRRALDIKPDAAAIRLELGRMQALLGNYGAAEREFRSAQASGLPDEVAQTVRFFARALSAQKQSGASIELALAPDSNINRATRSDTLGTVLGDFTLASDARARSGTGLALRAQGWRRMPLGRGAALLTRISGSADLYRDGTFNDLSLSLQAGPEFTSGKDRLALSAAISPRWYGGAPYSLSWGVTGNWQHPLSARRQLRVDAAAIRSDNHFNDLQDATRLSLSAGIDQAFSARAGGGIQASGQRELARDPGYSHAGGGIEAYLYREFGQTTAVVNLSYNHLAADARLLLFPRRRIDNRYSAMLSATFRALRLWRFAPLARLRLERNVSSIEVYDYRRIAGEVGVSAAF